MDREESVQHFLDLIKKSRRGKFKVYIGMIAGVGKSYRMLQEAHDLIDNGVDVRIGYIETHGRAGTEALLKGLPVIRRRKLFYKGKELEEMDLEAIIRIHPEIVIVDELAHTNVEGSLNEKRWQDVMTLLDEGINVISAVNIQHIESVNEEVQDIAGIEVKERIPDSVLQEADEVVNIDLTAIQSNVFFAFEFLKKFQFFFFFLYSGFSLCFEFFIRLKSHFSPKTIYNSSHSGLKFFEIHVHTDQCRNVHHTCKDCGMRVCRTMNCYKCKDLVLIHLYSLTRA